VPETTTATRPPTPGDDRGSLPLTSPQLPAIAPWLAAIVGFGLAGLIGLLLGWGILGILVLGWVLLFIGLPTWSGVVEGRRRAVDRLTTTLMWSTFVLAMIPLGALICRPFNGKERRVSVSDPNRRRVLKQALMLGLCTAHLYDPARPVLWTAASLTRGLVLFEPEGFYA